MILALAGFFVLLGFFVAPGIVRQVESLADRLPQSMSDAEDKLRQYSWGRRVLGDPGPDAAPHGGTDQGQGGSQPATPATQSSATQPHPAQASTGQPSTQPGQQPTLAARVMEAGTGPAAVKRATRIVNQLIQGLVALLVIVISGIYLAASPRMYINGLLLLTPHPRRPRYREVLARLAFTLRWWMIAQLVPMAVIGALTAVGLKIIGIELWFILGVLAALFNFIPNFGPLISGVPAFLLALAESPTKALWVVVLYIGAQSLEGYVLTPLVQRKAVELPPALLILFQVLAGLLLGALGLVLAAPLLAAVVVSVKMLYVEDVMGDDVHVPGDGEQGKHPDPVPGPA